MQIPKSKPIPLYSLTKIPDASMYLLRFSMTANESVLCNAGGYRKYISYI